VTIRYDTEPVSAAERAERFADAATMLLVAGSDIYHFRGRATAASGAGYT